MNLLRRLRRQAWAEEQWRRQWRREGFRELPPEEAAAIRFPEGRVNDQFRWGRDDSVWGRRS